MPSKAENTTMATSEAFLAACFQNCKEKPRVDYEKLAAVTNMSVGGAQNKLRAILKKFETDGSAAWSTIPPTSTTTAAAAAATTTFTVSHGTSASVSPTPTPARSIPATPKKKLNKDFGGNKRKTPTQSARSRHIDQDNTGEDSSKEFESADGASPKKKSKASSNVGAAAGGAVMKNKKTSGVKNGKRGTKDIVENYEGDDAMMATRTEEATGGVPEMEI